MILIAIVAALLLALVLLYAGQGLWAWVVPIGILLAYWALRGIDSPVAFAIIAVAFVLLAIVFGLAPIRRVIVSGPVMRFMAPFFPRMSDTERTALEAGTVWWDADLFSGAPDWRKLLHFQPKPLSDKERKFLEGPCQELCRMVDDWKVHQEAGLSPQIFEYMKTQGFLGMIIPEAFGGLGFSAIANSSVVAKVSSRSVTAAVIIMVPNSLGPAELLLHYGTDEQKRHWLPRLARGEEVPCFSLTEPGAGSDAGGLASTGVVCKGTYEGKEVLGMRLNWNKRYSTLGPVATVIGLAFRLHDPDHLLGEKEDLGITVALVPSRLPGIEHKNLHDPLSIPFINGPTTGKDVFVPLDAIVGGAKMAGQGWRMLMECLSAGRSISLPALATGAAQWSTRVTSAYGIVREQFGMSIGRFEGIEAPLARIGGTTYWLNAMRWVTAGVVDAGGKPAVISAIAKAWSTEAMRRVVNDAMDIQGGAGISRGPRNTLAHVYQALPIGITVEGANILTRSMIVFGQGAIRCHPYALREIQTAQAGDVPGFDEAFFGHVGFMGRNAARAFLLGLTGGALASTPPLGSRDVMKKFSRLSAAFALVSDAAMGTIGGDLKRKELISGRLADALAWMYVGSVAIRRFVEDAEPSRDLPFFRWATQESAYQVQEALRGVLDNLPNRLAALVLRPLVFPLGARSRPPSDRTTSAVARAMLGGGDARTALSRDIYVPGDDDPGLGRLESALRMTLACEPLRKKLRDAVKAKMLPRAEESELITLAVEKKVITAEEAKKLRDAAEARWDAVQVDEFSPAAYRALRG
ncbi:MAG: acyl-CoA dehydrogenase [Planctomycetota bacterium]